ncbi:spore autolysin SpoIIP [Bacillaceae bacterium]
MRGMRGPFRGFTLHMSGATIQKSFVLLSLGTAFLFIALGILAMNPSRVDFSSSSLRKIAAGVSSEMYVRIMQQEIPYLSSGVQARGEREKHSWSTFAFELVTSINPRDPRSFLGRELPGFEMYDFEILVAEKGIDYTDFPMESTPPPELITQLGKEADPAAEEPASREAEKNGKEKAVFIYHTHNTESWRYVTGNKDPDRAYDAKTNITLVGKRLGEELRKRGVEAIVDTTDYMKQIASDPRLTYAHSYALSLKRVQKVMTQNKNLRYFLDLHRDSSSKEQSTVKIKGKSYAQVRFVIGKANPNWEKNLQFAEKIYKKLNEKYPGIAVGITGKNSNEGNGEYNQSISPNSILVEVGGVDNTLTEVYNTAEALADVIADIYFEAQKVDAPPKPDAL